MWELKSKYVFRGILEMKTALHIGGGKWNFKNSDSPVVRTPDGYPFIPGSSFKGAFRSTVERLSVSVPGVSSCQLIEDELPDSCPTARPKDFAKQKEGLGKGFQAENALVSLLDQKLCSTCKLFGSPWSGSKIFFHDMKLKTPSDITEVRDGVMIDRDSERAVDQHKFDFETVPPTSEFEMEIMLENPGDTDLVLTCIGLNEFISEMAYIGGIKSRGLGNCKIKDLKIFKLDMERDGKEERLKKYLIHTKTEEKMEAIKPVNEFIQTRIETLFNRQNSEKEV